MLKKGPEGGSMTSEAGGGKPGCGFGDLKAESIRYQKAYFESIMENLPEAVAIFDENGNITRINAAFTTIFGYTAEEAVGRNISDLVAPPDRVREAHGIRRSISHGETIVLETMRRRRDGTDIHVSMKSAAVNVDGVVAGFFVVYRDITIRKLAEARLVQLATTDPLTGLYNRRHFFDLAEREFSRCRRTGAPLALLMMDMDNFKDVNDTHGHHAGDCVLTAVAATGRACFRSMDIFGRIGGEEFAVLLPETVLEQGAVTAARFRDKIEQMQVVVKEGVIVHVTVSAGVASAMGGKPGFEKVLADADRALYRAKCGGRNRIDCSGEAERVESAAGGKTTRMEKSAGGRNRFVLDGGPTA